MNMKNIIAATLIAVSALAAPMALAADLNGPSALNAPETFVSQNVNFDGPYAGIGVIYSNTNETVSPVISLGYDVRNDFLIVGAEVFGTIDDEFTTPTVGVDVKAGVVVTDNLVIYGIAGVQTDISDGDFVNKKNSFGVGADFAVTETISITGSYKQVFDLGTFDNRDDQFRAGVKVSF